MDRQDFLELVLNKKGQVNRMAVRLLPTSPNDKWKKAAQFLKDNCPAFIDDLRSQLVEAIRAIEQGTTIRPVCRMCAGRVSFYSGPPARYADFCSPRCGQRHPDTQAKVKASTLLAHGVPCVFQKTEVKARSISTRRQLQAETGQWPGPKEMTAEQRLAKGQRISQTKRANFAAGKQSTAAEAKMRQVQSANPEWSDFKFGPAGRVLSAVHVCGERSICPRAPFTCYSCQAPRNAQAQWHLAQELRTRYGLEVVLEHRLPNRMKVDLFFPQVKIGIELNGIYWHSEAAPKPRAPSYHQQKCLAARDAGIRLISIWEDEFRDKRDVVLGRLDAIFRPVRIGARACDVGKVDPVEAGAFLRAHHLDGAVRGVEQFWGLWYKDELVMVAALGAPRFSKDKTGLELLRLATKGGMLVIGGISKLVKAINQPFMTYSSLEWGGAGYLAAGGKEAGLTGPGYFYYNRRGATRHHRLYLSPGNFEKNTGVAYDRRLSEEENAKRVGCYRCYTAGSYRFTFGS